MKPIRVLIVAVVALMLLGAFGTAGYFTFQYGREKVSMFLEARTVKNTIISLPPVVADKAPETLSEIAEHIVAPSIAEVVTSDNSALPEVTSKVIISENSYPVTSSQNESIHVSEEKRQETVRVLDNVQTKDQKTSVPEVKSATVVTPPLNEVYIPETKLADSKLDTIQKSPEVGSNEVKSVTVVAPPLNEVYIPETKLFSIANLNDDTPDVLEFKDKEAKPTNLVNIEKPIEDVSNAIKKIISMVKPAVSETVKTETFTNALRIVETPVENSCPIEVKIDAN